MSEKDQNENVSPTAVSEDRPESAGRRSMLRGTATALPAILTLQSGAALARSSNLISTTHRKTTDRDGSVHCLDLRSVKPVGRRRGNTYDMGPNPAPDVYRISERDYYISERDYKRKNSRGRRRRIDESEGRWQPIDESELCLRGGKAAYKVGNTMHNVELPKRGGGMISVTALASFTSKAVIYDI